MAYPGDLGLDPKVQQRILTAFGESARLYRDGHPDEARTILRSILEVDSKFAPAQRLESAIASGSPVDLAQLLGEVTAAAPTDAEGTLTKARAAMAQRDYPGALALVQTILRDLPGHTGARQLALEVQAKIRATAEVSSHLERARQAFEAGQIEDARSFVALARNLDPSDPAVGELARRIELAAKPLATETEFEFEVLDQPAELEPAGVEPQAPMPPAPASPPPAVAPPAPATAPPAHPLSGRSAAPAAAQPSGSPPPPRQFPPQPAVPPSGPREVFTFDDGEDAGFEFGLGEQVAAQDSAAPSAGGGDRIQELLDQGQAAFDGGDFQGAIDTWSRIYLIDAHHHEAEVRIEQARRRREEADREAEHKFYEAREAFEQGRLDDARALCQEVLHLQPQHLEAHDLLVRMETPAAPPPPQPTAGAEEDDLFKDDFVPAKLSSSGALPVAKGQEAPPAIRRGAGSAARTLVQRRGFPVPLPVILIVLGLVAVLAVGFFMLRGRVFSSGGGPVPEGIKEAERLASAGRLQDAVSLLQSLQGQAEGAQGNQLNARILEFKGRLKAKAAAERKADTGPIRKALGENKRLVALRMIREALTSYPNDADLMKLQGEVTAYSPSLPALLDAAGGGRWDAVRQLAEQILHEHPADSELTRVWTNATFNQAVVLLRQYKVPEAHALLDDLGKKSNDPDAERLREFAKSYLSKPIDPRYQIFVTNVELRPLE
jgi:tetratricopeptide (TPR) repeat protein